MVEKKEKDPINVIENEEKDKPGLTKEQIMTVVRNVSLLRSQQLTKLLDDRRDMDEECGYPKTISIEQYKYLWDRMGIARRVVEVFPEETWALDPLVYETEDSEETEFEKAWNEILEKKNLFHYLERIDVMSGIGQYGILLIGINDGKLLSEPVEGTGLSDEKGTTANYEILYLRPFDESVVGIAARETDVTSPRYNLPTMYQVRFENESGNATTLTTQNIHWTRVIHVADGRAGSETLGTPRMQSVYNRLYDLRKLLGGSAEMFYKGAFPGMVFEADPSANLTTTAVDALKEQAIDYQNGLQRIMAMAGLTVKELSPQVADPGSHIEAQLTAIAITKGIPKRILEGSERGELASSQDKKTWNERVARRQRKYVTPMIIRAFVDRLISFGVLPEVEDYKVDWPDLNSPSDEDKANVAEKVTKAMASYIQGNVQQLVPPQQFLTTVIGYDADRAESIIKEADKYVAETDMEEEETFSDSEGIED